MQVLGARRAVGAGRAAGMGHVHDVDDQVAACALGRGGADMAAEAGQDEDQIVMSVAFHRKSAQQQGEPQAVAQQVLDRGQCCGQGRQRKIRRRDLVGRDPPPFDADERRRDVVQAFGVDMKDPVVARRQIVSRP